MSRRKPLSWAQSLQSIFCPARTSPPARARILTLEQLDQRIVPTLILNALPNVDLPTGTGTAGPLRFCIQQANATSDNNIIINFKASATYNLTISNFSINGGNGFGQQENGNLAGDLDIFDRGRVPGIKTYTFVGNGAIINQTTQDRIMQILGNDVNVIFQDLTFNGGEAVDDGTAVLPNTADGRGGAILNSGGADMSFTNCDLTNNCLLYTSPSPRD